MIWCDDIYIYSKRNKYIYIYIYTYIYIYMYIYVHIYIYINIIQICVYKSIDIYIYIYIYTRSQNCLSWQAIMTATLEPHKKSREKTKVVYRPLGHDLRSSVIMFSPGKIFFQKSKKNGKVFLHIHLLITCHFKDR